MVFSKIKQNIEYEENKTVDISDKHTNFTVYEHVLFEIDVEICIGNINNSNKIQNVLYCPVYLVKTNNNVIKIGIIEFTPIQMSYIFDENNEVNLDNVQILLYSFVTPQFIQLITGNEPDKASSDPEPEPKQVKKSNIETEKNTESTKENSVNNNNKSSDSTTTKQPSHSTYQTQPVQQQSTENRKQKEKLNITEVNEIKLNVNGSSKNSRKNKK